MPEPKGLYRMIPVAQPAPIPSLTHAVLFRCAIRYAVQSGSRIASLLPEMLATNILANYPTDVLTEAFCDMEKGLERTQKLSPVVRREWEELLDRLGTLVTARNQPVKAAPTKRRQRVRVRSPKPKDF